MPVVSIPVAWIGNKDLPVGEVSEVVSKLSGTPNGTLNRYPASTHWTQTMGIRIASLARARRPPGDLNFFRPWAMS